MAVGLRFHGAVGPFDRALTGFRGCHRHRRGGGVCP